MLWNQLVLNLTTEAKVEGCIFTKFQDGLILDIYRKLGP